MFSVKNLILHYKKPHTSMSYAREYLWLKKEGHCDECGKLLRRSNKGTKGPDSESALLHHKTRGPEHPKYFDFSDIDDDSQYSLLCISCHRKLHARERAEEKREGSTYNENIWHPGEKIEKRKGARWNPNVWHFGDPGRAPANKGMKCPLIAWVRTQRTRPTGKQCPAMKWISNWNKSYGHRGITTSKKGKHYPTAIYTVTDVSTGAVVDIIGKGEVEARIKELCGCSLPTARKRGLVKRKEK
jgi:hypothetical protein